MKQTEREQMWSRPLNSAGGMWCVREMEKDFHPSKAHSHIGECLSNVLDTHTNTHTYTRAHTHHTNTQPCACTLESATSQPSGISFPFRSTPSCDSVHQLFKFPCQSSQQVALMIRTRYPLSKNHAMSASLPPHLQLTCTPTFFFFFFF